MSQEKGTRSRPNSAEFNNEIPTSNGINDDKTKPNDVETARNEKNISTPRDSMTDAKSETGDDKGVPLAVEEEVNGGGGEETPGSPTNAQLEVMNATTNEPVLRDDEDRSVRSTDETAAETRIPAEKDSSPLEEDANGVRDQDEPEVKTEAAPKTLESNGEPAKEKESSHQANGNRKKESEAMGPRGDAVLVTSTPKKYEIIAVRERHGLFRKAVPVMPLVPAVVFCLLNVVTPGIGTLCAAFTVLCGCPTEHDNKAKSFSYNVVAALLQLITAPIVVGWVWSIFWGVTFVNVSVSKGADDTITVPVTSRV